jgi:hypothetical protein
MEAPIKDIRQELEQAIERRIMARTWRRVRQLRVQVNGPHVVISGRTPCYYAKQLVIAAVLEALDEAGAPAAVKVRIDVSTSPGRGSPPVGV